MQCPARKCKGVAVFYDRRYYPIDGQSSEIEENRPLLIVNAI
jgi:hypothetical protein